MTLAARSVLRDCELALEMMETETDPDRLRIIWVGALALIRLVGHVLAETDSKDDRYRVAISAHWEALKQSQDPTFWQFIKDYRDGAVKRYETRLPTSATITVAIPGKDGKFTVAKMEDCLLMPLEAGWREGEDARDVYRDAIDWWDYELSEIEGA